MRKIIVKLLNYFFVYPYYYIKYVIYKVQSGKPDMILCFRGGIGDQLLCTMVIREHYNRGKKVWFITNHKDLFYKNNHVSKVISENTARWMRLNIKYIYYLPPPANYNEVIPSSHILKLLCNKANIANCKIELKPVLNLTKLELKKGAISKNKIVISSSGMSAKHAMITKEWFFEYYQEVVSKLKDRYEFIQIGSENDPLIENVIDMRGKLKLRETASILSNSLLYIGQIGLLMHLARAVDCVSIIIYGGREKPWQSGYSCNINLENSPDCSPCWSYTCSIDRLCLRNVKPQQVINAINAITPNKKKNTY